MDWPQVSDVEEAASPALRAVVGEQTPIAQKQLLAFLKERRDDTLAAWHEAKAARDAGMAKALAEAKERAAIIDEELQPAKQLVREAALAAPDHDATDKLVEADLPASTGGFGAAAEAVDGLVGDDTVVSGKMGISVPLPTPSPMDRLMNSIALAVLWPVNGVVVGLAMAVSTGLLTLAELRSDAVSALPFAAMGFTFSWCLGYILHIISEELYGRPSEPGASVAPMDKAKAALKVCLVLAMVMLAGEITVEANALLRLDAERRQQVVSMGGQPGHPLPIGVAYLIASVLSSPVVLRKLVPSGTPLRLSALAAERHRLATEQLRQPVTREALKSVARQQTTRAWLAALQARVTQLEAAKHAALVLVVDPRWQAEVDSTEAAYQAALKEYKNLLQLIVQQDAPLRAPRRQRGLLAWLRRVTRWPWMRKSSARAAS